MMPRTRRVKDFAVRATTRSLVLSDISVKTLRYFDQYNLPNFGLPLLFDQHRSPLQLLNAQDIKDRDSDSYKEGEGAIVKE